MSVKTTRLWGLIYSQVGPLGINPLASLRILTRRKCVYTLVGGVIDDIASDLLLNNYVCSYSEVNAHTPF